MTGNDCTQETVFDRIPETQSGEKPRNAGISSSRQYMMRQRHAAGGIETQEDIERLLADTALEDWIDGQEVMIRLHISQRTLQTLRSNGTIPFSRIGHKLYYLRQDIERILCDNYIMLKLRERYGNDI